MNKSIKTIETNSIKYMLKFVEGYEQVKAKTHHKYKNAREFFTANDICYQNFYKFYRRYIESGREGDKLLPQPRGPKPKYLSTPLYVEGQFEELIKDYRQLRLNKYMISEAVKLKGYKKSSSPSSIYRILKRLGLSRLKTITKEERRKIVKHRRGELLHIDCHFLPKGILEPEPNRRYYAFGVIDDYSRIGWVEIIKSTKSIDATFAMMDALLILNQRYGIEAEEVITDNGSEFCSGDKEDHPFERLLLHFGLKHLRTKPYRPQTNGKIERFWRCFDDEVIEGSVFKTLDELKDAVLEYNFYYNELRPHQGINGKKPADMLEVASLVH